MATKLTNAIRESVGFQPISTISTGTYIEVDRLPQMEIIRLQGELNHTNHMILMLKEDIDSLTKKVERLEENKIVQFKENDVYEVNKRIERVEAGMALIESVLSCIVDSRIIQFLLSGQLKRPR
jgi:hypothetical protein